MHKNKTINYGRKMMKIKTKLKQRVKHIAPNHMEHTPPTCK